MDRRKKQTANRAQASDSDQAGGQRPVYGRQQRERRSPLRKIVPVLFIAAIALLIARQEIPAVHDWWEMTFSPDSWRAQNSCRQAVIDDSGKGRYLRVLEPGDVHNTMDGPYVDNLLVVELGANGVEERVAYTCYLDKQGRLFRLNRKSDRRPTDAESNGH
jgi:hypothetical protein